MPQVFKIGSYLIYFWINEGKPLEPIHVHIAEGKPSQNGIKIWITQTGKALPAVRNTVIPNKQFQIMLSVIEARHLEIEQIWLAKFGEISYYC